MRARQSIIRRESSGSVTVFWLDRAALLSNVRLAAERLSRDRPEVSMIILFGSAANGRAVPGSDAYAMIVARNLGVRVELFVYTEAELASAAPAMARTAIKTGLTLFSGVER